MSPKLTNWLIKYSGGLISNEKQANNILLIFVILSIVISLFLIFTHTSSINTSEPPRTQIEKAGSPEEILEL